MQTHLLYFLLVVSTSLSAQTLTTTDVALFRGTSQEAPQALLADADDNIYFGASYIFDFLYDPAEEPLPGGQGRSGAVIKRNEQGETVWAYHARYVDGAECTGGCFGEVSLLALAPNDEGVFAGIEFNAAVDVDNGSGNVIVADGSAVVKLNQAGNFEEVYRLTSEIAPNSVDLSGLATDAAGNIYLSGSFRGNMTLTTGEDNLLLPQPGEGGTLFNGFIGKISPTGEIVWMHTIPTGQLNYPKDGLSYHNGELHWAGRTISGVDFDPTFVVLRSDLEGTRGSFVARYDTEGRGLSLFTFGDLDDNGFLWDLRLGPDGKYYGVGRNGAGFNLVADGDASPVLSAPTWIASWREDGSLRWHEEYPDVIQPTIAVDAAGIVYLSASTGEAITVPGPNGAVSIDPGIGEISFLQPVSHEGFLSDPVQLSSSSQTRAYDATVSPSGKLHWTGTYRGELTDPNGQIVASEDIDIFLLTLDGAISVGTSTPEASPALSLFPNPTTDRLNVANLAYSEGVIIDGFGRTVRQLGNETISTRGLPAGVYFLRLRTNQGWMTGRFLKQ